MSALLKHVGRFLLGAVVLAVSMGVGIFLIKHTEMVDRVLDVAAPVVLGVIICYVLGTVICGDVKP